MTKLQLKGNLRHFIDPLAKSKVKLKKKNQTLQAVTSIVCVAIEQGPEHASVDELLQFTPHLML